MKDALLSSKELWTCYQCGECAETCPTQADPSEFMAADPPLRHRQLRPAPGSPGRCTRSPSSATVIARAPGRLLRRCSCTRPTGRRTARRWRSSSSSPRSCIHNIGIVVMIRGRPRRAGRDRDRMARRIAPSRGRRPGRRPAGQPRRAGAQRAGRVVARSARSRSARSASATTATRSAAAAAVAWYRRRWFVHAVTIWGFLGLLARDDRSTTAWRSSAQGDRHAGAALVPGPPARDRRRPRSWSTARRC